MSSATVNIENRRLPFVSGFALQGYLPAELGIIEAKKNHYDHWYIDGSLDSERPVKWDATRINCMLESIKAYNVKPLFHGNFKVPLASDVDEIRHAALEYTKAEIDLAAKLFSPLIIHAGMIVEPRLIREVKKRALENYLDSLNILTNYASQRGVILYLENLSNYEHYRPFHYIFTNAEEIEFILNSTALQMLFDIGHANIGNNNPLEIFIQHHKRIAGVSISNNDGLRDQHLGIDKGTIDYKQIISTMLQCNWQGIVGIEIRDRTSARSIEDLVKIYNDLNRLGSNQTKLDS